MPLSKETTNFPENSFSNVKIKTLILKPPMSHLMTKPTKWLCAQRRLGCSGWSESSLCTQWVAKDPGFLHVDSEDSDQTGRMPRLIRVFAGRIATLLFFFAAQILNIRTITVRTSSDPNFCRVNSTYIQFFLHVRMISMYIWWRVIYEGVILENISVWFRH